MLVHFGGGRVWWDPPAALLYASVDQHSALRGSALRPPREALPFPVPPHITQPVPRSRMQWAHLPSVAELMPQLKRVRRAAAQGGGPAPAGSSEGGSLVSTPRFPHLNAFSGHRDRASTASPQAGSASSPGPMRMAPAASGPAARNVVPPSPAPPVAPPHTLGTGQSSVESAGGVSVSPSALNVSMGSVPASPSPLGPRRGMGTAQGTSQPRADNGDASSHASVPPVMDMGPPALPMEPQVSGWAEGRAFSDISAASSKRDRSGTNDSVNTVQLLDPGARDEDEETCIDTAGQTVPSVALGDPLLPLLTYVQQEACIAAGDTFALDGLFSTPVLQYTEAVLPANEETAAKLQAAVSPSSKMGAGGFPGPTISLFGHAFPAQQLLAVLGSSVLVLAKAANPSLQQGARSTVNSSGSQRVRSSLQARYGSQPTAQRPQLSVSNSASAAIQNDSQAMALCVIPVHMLSTRWMESSPTILELRCTSLGRIPLMSTVQFEGGVPQASGVTSPMLHACTLQCSSAEAALALRRRLHRASTSRLATRHGAAAALVQQPLLAAAGEVCWRPDLLLQCATASGRVAQPRRADSAQASTVCDGE